MKTFTFEWNQFFKILFYFLKNHFIIFHLDHIAAWMLIKWNFKATRRYDGVDFRRKLIMYLSFKKLSEFWNFSNAWISGFLLKANLMIDKWKLSFSTCVEMNNSLDFMQWPPNVLHCFNQKIYIFFKKYVVRYKK